MTTTTTMSTSVDWPAVAVGGAGVVLAVGSLTWQAVTFRFTGSRVRARLRVGVIVPGGILSGETQVATYQVKPGWEQRFVGLLQQLPGGTAVFELEASNVGRTAVGMEKVVAKTENGHEVSLPTWDVNPRRGTSLEGGHRSSWYVPIGLVQRVVDAYAGHGRPIKCWMELALGNDTTVRTREHVTLEPLLPIIGMRPDSSDA
jgi:hypothetical protein